MTNVGSISGNMKTDLTYLKNMAGGNIGFVKEMINIFDEQVTELKVEMLESLKTGNWNGLSKLAHKAKSSAAVMGMNDLAAELKSLETLAGEGKEVDRYNKIVNNFISECEIAIVELTKAAKEL